MNLDIKRCLCGIVEFFVLAALTMVVPLLMYIDLVVMDHGMLENSFTEWTQEGLLLLSAILFAFLAWRKREARGFFVLVAGLLGCMLIRECDWLFDHIRHGFWLWPALTLAVAAVAYACYSGTDTIVPSMGRFFSTKPYYFMLFGMIVVLVLSQTVGSGGLLWKPIMGDDYRGELKTGLQEGLELFGYLFVALGAVQTFWGVRSGKYADL